MSEWQFPAVIDNTMMKDWRRCPQYFMRKHCQGLQVKENEISIDLHFGAAFAKGIEMGRRAYFDQRLPAIDAVDAATEAAAKFYGTRLAPPRSAKTLENLLDATCSYFRQWPLDEDNLVPVEEGIEHAFSFELPINHPVTGIPLRYCGSMDMLAIDRERGDFVVVDEKTASRFSDAWFTQWDMDTQLTGYLYFVELCRKTANIDVLVKAQIRGTGIASTGITHVCANVWRTQHMLDLWHTQLIEDVCHMVACFTAFHFDYRMGNSCITYARPCEYTRLCTSPNPESFIEQYDVKFWNPLKRSSNAKTAD